MPSLQPTELPTTKLPMLWVKKQNIHAALRLTWMNIPEAMKEKALEWYLRGIKRGMKKATDLMLDGEIYMQEGTVFAPDIISIKVKTRFKDEEWRSREYEVLASEIGFDEL